MALTAFHCFRVQAREGVEGLEGSAEGVTGHLSSPPCKYP